MLVITRKNGQKIMINDDIEITVVEAKNGYCKIAIKADKNVKIYREEIYLQIKLANLIGTNSKVSAVDSVSQLIKEGNNLLNNSKIEAAPANDEVIVEDKNSKSIKISKKNEWSQ